MITRSRLSRAYVRAAITVTADDGTPVDPTALAVQFAFVPVGTAPVDADWHDATHLSGNRFGLLVGPGALELPAGDFDIWRHIADDPEDDRERFGQIRLE
jgi:hypothetical protein